MFGKHLEPAEATVLYAEMSSVSNHIYEFILDVRTASGQVFRADKKQEFAPFTHPKVGDVVKVKYNPKNMKVEFDLKGDARYDSHAQEAATKARHDALLASQPGMPLPQDALQAQHHQVRLQLNGALGGLDLNEIVQSALANGNAKVIHMDGSQGALSPEVLERLQKLGGMQGIASLQHLQGMQGMQNLQGMQGMQNLQGMRGQADQMGFQGQSGQVGQTGQSDQAQQAFTQSDSLRAELQSSGVSGSAMVLYVEEAGMTFPPFVAQRITARVQETASYQVFDCTFTTWIDPRKVQLSVGSSINVRYDPSNHDRIIMIH